VAGGGGRWPCWRWLVMTGGMHCGVRVLCCVYLVWWTVECGLGVARTEGWMDGGCAAGRVDVEV
jgi:hypothetical protein